MFTLLLVGILTSPFNIQLVRASGTIYIRADGSVDPPTASISSVDNVTYIFTDNINDSIVVKRDDIVVDGAGYTLQGTGSGTGVVMSDRINITIRNLEIKEFKWGVYATPIDRNIRDFEITGNNITNNQVGIYFYLFSVDNVIITGNNIANNDRGIDVFVRWGCISGNNIIANGKGIVGGFSSSVISGNNISANDFGIDIEYSGNNEITGNIIAENTNYGIAMWESMYNIISWNTITKGYSGIRGNYVHDNIVYGNNITNMSSGISLDASARNRFYHNNLSNNTQHVWTHWPECTSDDHWNNDYPSGGNYWSDYVTVDFQSGPYQNETGSDGIGDIPYVVDGNNNDSYPLMKPYGLSHDIGIANIVTSKTVVGRGYGCDIDIMIVNFGVSAETFNVTAYANTTIVQNLANIVLTSRNSTTLTFEWNTTGFAYGNYAISAVANTVPGETDTSDNSYVDGWVTVTIPGDIVGDPPPSDPAPDGDVDWFDFGYFAQVYGKCKGDLTYDPNADLNCDGCIDWFDFGILAQNYGKII